MSHFVDLREIYYFIFFNKHRNWTAHFICHHDQKTQLSLLTNNKSWKFPIENHGHENNLLQCSLASISVFCCLKSQRKSQPSSQCLVPPQGRWTLALLLQKGFKLLWEYNLNCSSRQTSHILLPNPSLHLFYLPLNHDASAKKKKRNPKRIQINI